MSGMMDTSDCSSLGLVPSCGVIPDCRAAPVAAPAHQPSIGVPVPVPAGIHPQLHPDSVRGSPRVRQVLLYADAYLSVLMLNEIMVGYELRKGTHPRCHLRRETAPSPA